MVPQHLRMDKASLVSDELRALLEALRKLSLHELFELLVVSEVNPVPELWLSMMQVVDAVQIHVLFVPAEHSLPRANINVRFVDPRYLLVLQAFPAAGL